MTTEELLKRIGHLQNSAFRILTELESIKILVYTDSLPENYGNTLVK